MHKEREWRVGGGSGREPAAGADKA
jgi:hypothetical protein